MPSRRAVEVSLCLLLLVSGSASAGTFQMPLTSPSTVQCYDHPSSRGYHTGWDIYSSDPNVYAVADGTIVLLQPNDPCSPDCTNRGCPDHAMGNTVIIEHTLSDGTNVYSLYAHLAWYDGSLRTEQCITAGTVIGHYGGSGNGCANKWDPHLHFELKDRAVLGAPVNSDRSWGYTPTSADDYGFHDPTGYIPLAACGGGSSRSYQNLCSSSSCVPDQYSSDYRQAAPIRTSSALRGECVNPSNDEDWFYFFASSGQHVTADVAADNSSLRPQVAIRKPGCTDASCPAVASATASSSGGTASISVTLPDTGRYFVKIRGYGTSTGKYLFDKNVIDDTSQDVPGTVDLGSSQYEFVHYPGDEDWYAFSLSAGQRAAFDIQNRNGSTTTENQSLKLQTAIYRELDDGSEKLAYGADNENPSVDDAYVEYTSANGGTYYLKVRGYGSQVGYYRIRSSVDVPCPSVIDNTSGIGLSSNDTQIDVSWNPVANATAYRVRRDNAIVYDGAATSFTDSGLQPTTSYCYDVEGYNDCSSGPRSLASCATTTCREVTTYPAPPSLEATSPTSIAISWSSVPGATAYRLYRYSTLLYDGPATAFTDTAVSANSRYCYSVVAYNGCGGGRESNAACVDTPCPSIGAGPTPQLAAQSGPGFTVSWNAAANATGYRLYRNGSLIYDGTARSVSDGSLRTGTQYCYFVQPYNSCAFGTTSATVCATTPVLQPPAAVSATATSTTAIHVSWSAASNAGSYWLYRASAGAPLAFVGAFAGTSFVDTNVTAGATYLYRVRSVDLYQTGSAFSTADIATTIVFTDDPLSPRVTRVRSSHLTELRNAVNALRALANLAPYAFTSAPAGTPIRGLHLRELRTKLDEARAVLGLAPVAHAEAIVDGTTLIRVTHLQEIRTGVK